MLLALLAIVADLPDEELVRRAQGGDRFAFSQLVKRYQDRIYGLCMRWLGDPQVAEELAQDIFVAVFRSLGTFRGDARFSTWLHRVAVNHCKNRRLYRRRRAWNRHEPLEGNRGPDERPRQLSDDRVPSTDRGAEQRQAGRIVQEALAELEEDHRQVLILRDIQDLDYQEIAEILDLPRGTVKSRIHRARSQLAKILGNRIGKEDVRG